MNERAAAGKPQPMKNDLLFRQMLSDDYIAFCQLEKEHMRSPYSVRDVEGDLCKKYVIESSKTHKMVGYAVYTRNKGTIGIKRIFVKPEHRRRGTGRDIFERISKTRDYSKKLPQTVLLYIPEPCLSAQLFAKSIGMRCTRIDKDHFENGDSAYVFFKTLL